jgi:hypothetical protein
MKTKTKTLLTGLISLVMLNASFVPVFANPVIEQETSNNQEIQVNSPENSLILTPATKDTTGAVQIVPLKAYVALKGEASLEGKQLLPMMSESSASLGNKQLAESPLTVSTETSLTSEDYFVVLPEGEHLTDEELEQIEGEGLWFVPGLYGAGAGALMYGGKCWLGWASNCTWKGAAVAAGKGFVKAYLPWTPAGVLVRVFW